MMVGNRTPVGSEHFTVEEASAAVAYAAYFQHSYYCVLQSTEVVSFCS